MSTPIIGGGDDARAAIVNLENASVGWSKTKRDDGVTLLENVAAALQAVADGADPADVAILWG